MKIEIELNNLTAEEQETAKRLAKKKEKPYFVPKEDDEYFGIAYSGDIAFNISIGNCFRTKEEAKEALTRLQMQTKWKRLSLEAGEADNPWDGEHKHYEVWYSDCWNEIRINYIYSGRYGTVTFPSEDSIKAAIAEIGEENVKKYILGVEQCKR